MNDHQLRTEADRRIALLDIERHESGERLMTPEQLAYALKAAGAKARRYGWEMEEEGEEE